MFKVVINYNAGVNGRCVYLTFVISQEIYSCQLTALWTLPQ